VEIHRDFGETFYRHRHDRRSSQRRNQPEATPKSLLLSGFLLGLVFDPNIQAEPSIETLVYQLRTGTQFFIQHCQNRKSSVKQRCPCASHWTPTDLKAVS
jgi:hypothetical protein